MCSVEGLKDICSPASGTRASRESTGGRREPRWYPHRRAVLDGLLQSPSSRIGMLERSPPSADALRKAWTARAKKSMFFSQRSTLKIWMRAYFDDAPHRPSTTGARRRFVGRRRGDATAEQGAEGFSATEARPRNQPVPPGR